MKGERRAPKGYLCLILHAHLPYVRHPELPESLEETWLFEAISECYLPLLRVLEKLAEEEVPYRLTLSVSPPLAAMLGDELLQERYLRHLDRLLALCNEEIRRTRGEPELHRLARLYRHMFARCRRDFSERYGRNLLAAFRRLADEGFVELWASAASHAYLPLLAVQPEALRMQIGAGIEEYRKWFGRPPRGFWLPECGLAPEVTAELARWGIACTVAEAHALLYARPTPRRAVYAPLRCALSGVAVFGRDPRSAEQVWSAEQGYPGHPDYRDFYRDVGFDRDYEAVAPYLKGGVRSSLGLKYYRVTGRPDKEVYEPRLALARCERHARHFLACRRRQIRQAAPHMDRPPVIVAPYDAELFGHWWFEGPVFLEHLLRIAAQPDSDVCLITPSDYLDRYPDLDHGVLAPSSWGEGGYHGVWLHPANDWLQRHLYFAAERLAGLFAREPHPRGLRARAVNQAVRELLLAQSSDWAFMLRVGTFVEYARQRLLRHLERFERLYLQLQEDALDPRLLAVWEWQDRLFPELDWRYVTNSRSSAGGISSA